MALAPTTPIALLPVANLPFTGNEILQLSKDGSTVVKVDLNTFAALLTSGSGTAPSAQTESASGVVINSTSGLIVDSGLALYTLRQPAASGLQLYRGVAVIADPANINGKAALYYNHTVYFEDVSGNWFLTSGDSFILQTTGDPRSPVSTGGSTTPAPGTGTNSLSPSPSSVALFYDDFKAPSIDWNKWNPEYLYSSASEGSIDGAAFRIDPRSPPYAGANPFSLANGMLTISTNPTPPAHLAEVNNLPFTSGLLNTQGKFSTIYGYFSIRAKISNGSGMTCQFWLMPNDGTWPPELDIMEVIGRQPGTVSTDAFWGAANAPTTNSQHYYTDDLSTTFHDYSCDWQADFITWFIDGIQFAQMVTPDSMRVPMHLIVSMSVGAAGSWQGYPPDGLAYPQTYQIESVTVLKSRPASLTAVANESAEGASVTTVGPTLRDAQGHVYSISPAGYIVQDGQEDRLTSSGVVQLYYHNHQLWQRNYQGNWYTRVSISAAYTGPEPSPIPTTAPAPLATAFAPTQPVTPTRPVASGTITPPTGGSGPASSSGFITADFTNFTSGAGKYGVKVLPQLFGVSSGGFDNNNWQWVNNGTFRSKMRDLNLPLFRVHSQWQAKGNNIDTLISNIGSMVPASCTMVIGINDANTGQTISNKWRTGSPNPCTLWEYGNEHGLDQNGINTLIQSLQWDNSANRIAGDVNAGLNAGQLQSMVNSMSDSTLGLLDQHQYHYCNGADPYPGDDAICLADGKYRGFIQSLDSTINSGYGSTLPFLMGEYNIECGAWDGDKRAGTSIGACFLISSLLGMQDATLRPIYGAIWDLMDDGGAAYNLIDGGMNLYPQYYTLQRLIATMPGNLVNTTSGWGGVKAWATQNADGFGVAIVNSNGNDVNGPVALSHWPANSTGNGSATLWTYPTTNLNNPTANTPGVFSTISVTNGVTQDIRVPAKSCVIIST